MPSAAAVAAISVVAVLGLVGASPAFALDANVNEAVLRGARAGTSKPAGAMAAVLRAARRLGTVTSEPIAFETTRFGSVVAVAIEGPTSKPRDAASTRVCLLSARDASVLHQFELSAGEAGEPVVMRRLNLLFDAGAAGRAASSLYGSDTAGRIWRMDVDGEEVGHWSTTGRIVASLALRDPTAPAIVRDPVNRGDRWIVVAGRDPADPGQASLLALRETASVAGLHSSKPSGSPALLIDAASLTPVPLASQTAPAATRGWRIDLSTSPGTQVATPVVSRELVLWHVERPGEADMQDGGSTVVARALRSGANRLANRDAFVWPVKVVSLRLAPLEEPVPLSSRLRYRLVLDDAAHSSTTISLQPERMKTAERTSVRVVVPVQQNDAKH